MAATPYLCPRDMKYPEWQQPLLEVLVEFDPVKLPEKVARAEAAIKARLVHLARMIGHQDELQAIEDGLSSLRILTTKTVQSSRPGSENSADLSTGLR